MSLINDALKKAQKQRTGDAPPLASMPSIGGQPAAKIAKRGQPAGLDPLLVKLGLGAGGLVLLVIAGWIVLRPKPSAVSRQLSAPLPAVAQQTVGQTPAGQQAGTVPPAPAFSLPIAVPSAPTPETVATRPAVTETKPATTVTPVVTVQTPPPEAAKPAAPAPKLEGKAIDYIEGLHIAGIRASATDSKVLMNDRVYRLGDMVERQMGLKLVGITSSSLTFENEAGARYTRTF